MGSSEASPKVSAGERRASLGVNSAQGIFASALAGALGGHFRASIGAIGYFRKGRMDFNHNSLTSRPNFPPTVSKGRVRSNEVYL
jgi:hypothetical protein